jgi:hypothetical protein
MYTNLHITVNGLVLNVVIICHNIYLLMKLATENIYVTVLYLETSTTCELILWRGYSAFPIRRRPTKWHNGLWRLYSCRICDFALQIHNYLFWILGYPSPWFPIIHGYIELQQSSHVLFFHYVKEILARGPHKQFFEELIFLTHTDGYM